MQLAKIEHTPRETSAKTCIRKCIIYEMLRCASEIHLFVQTSLFLPKSAVCDCL